MVSSRDRRRARPTGQHEAAGARLGPWYGSPWGARPVARRPSGPGTAGYARPEPAEPSVRAAPGPYGNTGRGSPPSVGSRPAARPAASVSHVTDCGRARGSTGCGRRTAARCRTLLTLPASVGKRTVARAGGAGNRSTRGPLRARCSAGRHSGADGAPGQAVGRRGVPAPPLTRMSRTPPAPPAPLPADTGTARSLARVRPTPGTTARHRRHERDNAGSLQRAWCPGPGSSAVGGVSVFRVPGGTATRVHVSDTDVSARPRHLRQSTERMSHSTEAPMWPDGSTDGRVGTAWCPDRRTSRTARAGT